MSKKSVAEEVQELRTEILAEIDAAEKANDLEKMEKLVALLEDLNGDIQEPEATDEDESEGESEDEKPAAETESKSEDNADSSEETPAMAASGKDIEVPEGHEPVTASASTAVITAGTDIPGFAAGQRLEGELQIAEAFAQRLGTLRRVSGGDGDQHIVASIRVDYPEDRTLTESDFDRNGMLMDAVISPSAITAAGGWCAPLPTIYDFAGDLGVTGRPIRDALPKFQATRGGVQYVRPPELKDLRGAFGFMDGSDGSLDYVMKLATAAGVTLSRNGGDIVGDSGALTATGKPCATFGCPAPEKAIVDAITMCLTFDNLPSRAYPELIARYNRLALVEQARLAENVLLAKMFLFAAAEPQNVIYALSRFGVARDLAIALSKAAVSFRFRHRLPENYPLNFIAPQWLKDVMREDLFVGLPGDNWSVASTAALTKFFSDRNIRPIWHYDGFMSDGASTIGKDTWTDDGTSVKDTTLSIPTDAFNQGGNENFPGQVTGFLYAEGSLVFMDSGNLDLGIVRDSKLNAANQYSMFSETFEGLANVGFRPMVITTASNVAGLVNGTLAAPTLVQAK